MLKVYGATASFPREELFGLTQQMRRAAVSVPSNIAEGFGRYWLADYICFLDIALGSVFELQTQLRLAHDLNYLKDSAILDDATEVARILNGLIASLRRRLHADKKKRSSPTPAED